MTSHDLIQAWLLIHAQIKANLQKQKVAQRQSLFLNISYWKLSVSNMSDEWSLK